MASARVQGYVQALLQNPEFLKTVAHRYSNSQGIVSDNHGNLIANVSMEVIATAISNLETALSKSEEEEN